MYLEVPNELIYLEFTLPLHWDISKIFHRGCVDFQWSCPWVPPPPLQTGCFWLELEICEVNLLTVGCLWLNQQYIIFGTWLRGTLDSLN